MAANKAREPNRKIRVSRGQAAAGMDYVNQWATKLPVRGIRGAAPTYFAYSSATNLRRASRERFTFSVEMQ